MKNSSIQKEVIEESIADIKIAANAFARCSLGSIFIIALFFIPDNWHFITFSIYFIPFIILMTLLGGSLMGMFLLFKFILSMRKALRSEHDSIAFLKNKREQREKLKEKSELSDLIIGNVYAVVSKGSQETEVWFTESENGWDLKEKFGWWQYKKRVNPHPSSTHDIHLVARNVPFESTLQRRLDNKDISEEERRLRRERYLLNINNIQYNRIYVINDKMERSLKIEFVGENKMPELSIKHKFFTSTMACSGDVYKHLRKDQ